MQAVEQALDEPFVGAGSGVLEKLVDLGRRGRQPEQVQRQPAKQRKAAGFGRRGETLAIKTGEDEGVDGISDFGFRVSDLWDFRA